MTDGKGLINDFIELAVQHGQTVVEGDSKKGNKLHLLLSRRVNQISSLDAYDKKLFYELLNHDNDSVRIWVAVELLGTFPNKAIGVLENITLNKNIFGLTAKLTLEMISKGMIKKEDWNKG